MSSHDVPAATCGTALMPLVMPMIVYATRHTIAAGKAMRRLARNLSAMATCWVRVAATVVSLINDRLSPKNEPPSTMATISATSLPVAVANWAASGVSATIVPTLVPIDIEMKHAVTNKPGSSAHDGSNAVVAATVASTAPMPLASAEKAPLRIKIQII